MVLFEKYYRKSLKYKKICIPLHPLLAKQMFNLFINQYESIRNRFHFNSRFV